MITCSISMVAPGSSSQAQHHCAHCGDCPNPTWSWGWRLISIRPVIVFAVNWVLKLKEVCRLAASGPGWPEPEGQPAVAQTQLAEPATWGSVMLGSLSCCASVCSNFTSSHCRCPCPHSIHIVQVCALHHVLLSCDNTGVSRCALQEIQHRSKLPVDVMHLHQRTSQARRATTIITVCVNAAKELANADSP